MKRIFYTFSTLFDKPVILWWALALGTLLFSLGISLPMLTISKFIIIRDSFSILTGLFDLLESGQIIIFLLVAAFSVVLPVLKISTLYLLLSKKTSSTQYKKILHIMHEYGRWAMLDVMIVALLVVTVKLGAIASIQVHSGFYIFGLAALLLMIVTGKVSKLVQQSAG
jgi:paraquat-inducible protein A